MTVDVTIRARADDAYDVGVRHASGLTHHAVTVPADLAVALGRPDLDPVGLVRASFQFLLEREPATSIMSAFSLDVISTYFPEYRGEMARRLR
jgi:hypothetical protein